jgi:hypothetical protein
MLQSNLVGPFELQTVGIIPHSRSYFNKKFSETNIIKMLELKKKQNIFVMLSERGFQQIVCIPICTNCGPLLSTYEADLVVSVVTLISRSMR